MSDSISPISSVVWADPAREHAFQTWLTPLAVQHGLELSTLRPASADASFRRYLRLDRSAGGSLIVMDAPPDKENCAPFVQVQGLMQQAGLNVPPSWTGTSPRLHAALRPGQPHVIEVLDPARPQDAELWYRHAVDLLLQWQQASGPACCRRTTRPCCAASCSCSPTGISPSTARSRWTTSSRPCWPRFDQIVAHNLQAPSVYVHRDFMARNLMLPSDPAPLGVLDFQDAVYGPITYDIASLLRDAFLSWEEDFVIDITVRYWEKARRSGLIGANSASGWGDDFGEFYRAVEWMGLQRHLKVAGIFARLTLRDGKPKYLADTPRFIHYIRTTCSRYRELAPLLRLVDQIEGIQAQVGYAYGRM
jgi:aminoglycoside/choline kinase family phosphotransferase